MLVGMINTIHYVESVLKCLLKRFKLIFLFMSNNDDTRAKETRKKEEE